ncbi:MAG: hypothetical protein L0I76_36220 [Pseudonocardia sp.]|nr:hypothetical protein [Pseudonocardia sp.]MDN5920487.1 hypothetical protein [Pseudonocardia sp.]
MTLLILGLGGCLVMFVAGNVLDNHKMRWRAATSAPATVLVLWSALLLVVGWP